MLADSARQSRRCLFVRDAGYHHELLYGRQIEPRPPSRWFYPDLVIDGTADALFASEVSFCGLNGNVTEQKLDLF
jgi:hypothetical protein